MIETHGFATLDCYSQEELKQMIYDQKNVIRAFYDELQKLGIRPGGVYAWTVKDGRRFAQAIAEAKT